MKPGRREAPAYIYTESAAKVTCTAPEKRSALPLPALLWYCTSWF